VVLLDAGFVFVISNTQRRFGREALVGIGSLSGARGARAYPGRELRKELALSGISLHHAGEAFMSTS